MRQTMQRYVPPSRRRADGEHGGDAETELRALEGAAPVLSQVRLVVLQQGISFDPASCPLDIEAQQANDSRPEGGDGSGSSASTAASAAGPDPSPRACAAAPCSTHLIFFPERLPVELLRWLGDTFPSGAARLEFPPALSKAERARWHKAADRARLHGESVGIGEGRYLTITTAASPPWGREGGQQEEAGATSGGRPRLTREQAERARFIWDCAQMEGGKHWERSRGEVEAMVASGEPLPEDLQALVDKRLRGREVHRLLKGGQPSEALSLLSEDPKLAWVKDSQTGGYPIHQAAWKGYESVVLFLASLPGVLEQRDGQRNTALAVAQRRQHRNIVDLLLEAGANPEHASFGPSPALDGRAAGVQAEEAGAGAEEEYCSWSSEERWRYRHGGAGGMAPPGLQHHGRGGREGGSWSHGRGHSHSGMTEGRGGRMRRSEQQMQQGEQYQQQSQCPW